MRYHRSIERDFPHIVEIAVRRGWRGTRDAMKDFHFPLSTKHIR